jgi:hypothetical protein
MQDGDENIYFHYMKIFGEKLKKKSLPSCFQTLFCILTTDNNVFFNMTVLGA